MRHESDILPDQTVERSTSQAMQRGWRRRCPNCGGGPMMSSFLKVRNSCPACGEELHHHRADDMPAWATIIIVGKAVIGALLAVEIAWAPVAWVHWVLWPTVALIMTLWLLPRIKGAVVGMQWAMRMHGFENSAPKHPLD